MKTQFEHKAILSAPKNKAVKLVETNEEQKKMKTKRTLKAGAK